MLGDSFWERLKVSRRISIAVEDDYWSFFIFCQEFFFCLTLLFWVGAGGSEFCHILFKILYGFFFFFLVLFAFSCSSLEMKVQRLMVSFSLSDRFRLLQDSWRRSGFLWDSFERLLMLIGITIELDGRLRARRMAGSWGESESSVFYQVFSFFFSFFYSVLFLLSGSKVIARRNWLGWYYDAASVNWSV